MCSREWFRFIAFTKVQHWKHPAFSSGDSLPNRNPLQMWTHDASERTMRWLRILKRQRNRFQCREGQINRCIYERLCELQELLKKTTGNSNQRDGSWYEEKEKSLNCHLCLSFINILYNAPMHSISESASRGFLFFTAMARDTLCVQFFSSVHIIKMQIRIFNYA